MLTIKNVNLEVDKKEILHDFNLNIKDGEIHVIMGPNGVGKSSICKAIMGDKKYHLTNGSIYYNDNDLSKMSTTDIARLGIMLISQNPIAIPGVSNADMLRNSIASKTGKQVNIYEFNKKITEVVKKLDLPTSFIHRSINDGMSGGERKKNELMHMWMLEPNFIILDELDSGLDVDALKICSKSLNEYYEKYKPSILIITHHTQILDNIKPNYVHILTNGTITYSGDLSTAKSIEANGFNDYLGQIK